MMENDACHIVYVLTNSAMPKLVKIGMTRREDVNERLNDLYTTGVPVPFECVYAARVKDCAKVEAALHTAFTKDRINPRREFFELEPESVISILQLLAVEDMTPEVERELDEGVSDAEKSSGEKLKRKRRPPMNYRDMGILPGSVLVFRDGTTTVEVIGDRKVRHHDEEMSLTAVTQELLGSEYSVQPTPFWTYQGRSLTDIYEDTYSHED